jgi:hypothetical protein
MPDYNLSLSRMLAWRQCPRRLWLEVRRCGLPETDDEAAPGRQFDGEVKKAAQSLFPNGILIRDDESLLEYPDSSWQAFMPRPAEVKRLLNRLHRADSTRLAMSDHPDLPIIDATFLHEKLYVCVDVLLPSAEGYRMVLLTSEARAEPWHIDECAVLAWVLERNGITPSSIELVHVDALFPEDDRPLFRLEKLDEAVRPLVGEVPGWILASRRILAGEEPGIDPDLSCRDPETCPAESCGRRPTLARLLPGVSLRYFLPDLSANKNASAIMPGNADHGQSPLFFEAVAVLQRHCQANRTALIEQPVSLLQRRLRLGYRAALSLVGELERRGILSTELNASSEVGGNPREERKRTMTPDNTSKLYEDFPYLYRRRNQTAQACIGVYGFDCGDGWFGLIRELSERIEEIARKKGRDPHSDAWPEAVQVKQKAGRLRFYLAVYDEALRSCIEQAGDNSEKICEICGKPGFPKSDSPGGVATLCEDHAVSRRNASLVNNMSDKRNGEKR